MLPAVGQGALGLETREDDDKTREVLRFLDDEVTHHAVIAERAMLRSLRGGCLAPIGAWARKVNGSLRLDAVVLNPNGTEKVQTSLSTELTLSEELGCAAAERLLAAGAEKLLVSARDS
jgi:hydroxymethylbilane synthase